jgi:hypothetical protein
MYAHLTSQNGGAQMVFLVLLVCLHSEGVSGLKAESVDFLREVLFALNCIFEGATSLGKDEKEICDLARWFIGDHDHVSAALGPGEDAAQLSQPREADVEVKTRSVAGCRRYHEAADRARPITDAIRCGM